jgi:putative sigma-54 modulation protein
MTSLRLAAAKTTRPVSAGSATGQASQAAAPPIRRRRVNERGIEATGQNLNHAIGFSRGKTVDENAKSSRVCFGVTRLSHQRKGGTLDSTTLRRPVSSSLSSAHSLLPSPTAKGKLMNLTISGHHLEVTPALREYVLTKLDRVTRHFDQVVDINVLLSVEKLKEKERRQKAEVTLHVKGKDIFVENAHEDLYAAIDQLMDKLDRQVCRHKDKLQDHHHVSVKHIDATPG